jgi:hypothetical protein
MSCFSFIGSRRSGEPGKHHMILDEGLPDRTFRDVLQYWEDEACCRCQ